MAATTLISNAAVVTMDPALGDFERADILVRDGTIVAVGPGLADGGTIDAEVIDASSMIAMPGMVDTHRHTWQTALRGILADGNIPDYLRGIWPPDGAALPALVTCMSATTWAPSTPSTAASPASSTTANILEPGPRPRRSRDSSTPASGVSTPTA
ncbi:MAG: hypothetical protein U0R78_01575 [Nocardioidaceae bacterium]